jgi:hypothetical protein
MFKEQRHNSTATADSAVRRSCQNVWDLSSEKSQPIAICQPKGHWILVVCEIRVEDLESA